MRTTVGIYDIAREKAGPMLWAALKALVPNTIFGPDMFDCRLDRDDARVAKVLALLHEAGWRPEPDNAEPRVSSEKYYSYRIGHIYTKADYDSWELLRLRPEHFYEVITNWNFKKGRLGIDAKDLRQRGKTGFNFGNGEELMVSKSMLKKLEDAKFRGLKFRPALLLSEGRSVPRSTTYQYDVLPWSSVPDGPWHELTSEVILPPLTKRTPLRGTKGGPVSPDFSTGCWEMAIGYEMPGFHFARSALKKLPKFDMAMTYEHFGYYWSPVGHPYGWKREKIVSQRFHQFAREHKLKVEFWPVHIDEDF